MASVQLLSTLALKSINPTDLAQLSEQTLESILYNQPIQTLIQLKKQSPLLHILCKQIINKRTKFFTYTQNLPGQKEVSFFTADVSNITIIEAESAEEANKKANLFGIKFNDDPEFIEMKEEDPELYEEYVADDINRWYKATDEDCVQDINQLIKDLKQQGGFYSYYVHYIDGTMERLGQCRPAHSHDYFDFWDSYNKDYTNFPNVSGLSLLSRPEFEEIANKVQPPVIHKRYLINWQPID